MDALLDDAARRAGAYLDALGTRPVAPEPAALARLDGLDLALPETVQDPRETLRLLDEIGSPATMAMAGPRFFGFVTGGVLPAALAANWLAAAWDQCSSLYRVTPATARIEATALRWLLEVLRLPAGCAGAFVTGATMANFTALAAARHRLLADAGWDVEADGLFGAPPVTVVLGEEGHPTVYKSLGLLGFGRERVVRVPTDGQGRMRADALPPLSGPTVIIAQAGNVNTGACDPVAEIAALARAHGAWLHVDGAFGLWARAAPTRAALTDGVELADSWATDAHKWLNVPYDSGAAFVR
ncbi:MAG TPA: pyridoxal-dependent decarboxylase, partial [Gammaproteobacteria bacterium]